MKNTRSRFPVRYLPFRLSKRDRQIQGKELNKSKRLYKKGIYHTRAKVKTFKSKPSGHVANAKKLYKVDKIAATDELAKKTKCSRKALAKIIQKGEGAYFSSGSRPNQTGQSWGIARLASSITGGKAALVDFSILEEGCDNKTSNAYLLAKSLKRKTQKLRKSPKVFQ
jgi:hypothetical protein